MKWHLKYRIILVTVLFIICILFPLVNKNLALFADIPSFENRAMAEEPVLDPFHADLFPPLYDSAYNDHFTLRNKLIRYFNIYNVKMFRKSPLPDKVIIGHDNWLFPASEELDSYLGKNRLSERELEDFKKELEYRTAYLDSVHCKLYFVVVPCKASVYADKIGYEYYRITKQSWGEQVNEYLAKNSKVRLIDLFDYLRERKDDADLYYTLDNHWNNLGGLYASIKITSTLKRDFPEITTLNAADFTKRKTGPRKGNIEIMLGNLGYYTEDSTELNKKNGYLAKVVPNVPYPPTEGFAYQWLYEQGREVADPKKPKLLVISDSFGEYIFPFLAESFSRSVKIFDAWQYKLHEEIVKSEKPDVMLLMIDEPILREFLKHPSRPGATKY